MVRLPILPLTGEARRPVVPPPAWPVYGRTTLPEFKRLFKHGLDAVVDRLSDQELPKSSWKTLVPAA